MEIADDDKGEGPSVRAADVEEKVSDQQSID